MLCVLADRTLADVCRFIPPRSWTHSARIAESAEIGPYSIIGADVEIGARTHNQGHVFMEGPLTDRRG